MMPAYDELLLPKARITFANMLDYAVNGLRFSLREFYNMFLVSRKSLLFEIGDSKTIAGMSGIELAESVAEETLVPWDCETEKSYDRAACARSREYWVGYNLAYYQWKSGRSLREIDRCIDIDEIAAMYPRYHEMDLDHFTEKVDQIIFECSAEDCAAKLKRLRKYADLSQSRLAELSGIPVRTIQQYEQGQKDLAHARSDYLLTLARVLKCSPEELISGM